MSVWIRAALKRALRTFAQSAIGAVPVTAAVLGDVNWPVVFSGAALYAVLSLLMSMATGLPEAGTSRRLFGRGFGRGEKETQPREE